MSIVLFLGLFFNFPYKGADPTISNKYGLTPLFCSTYSNRALFVWYRHINKEIVELLVKAGADPNIADQDGWTPLQWAAYKGYREIVAILKKASGDKQSNKKYRSRKIKRS